MNKNQAAVTFLETSAHRLLHFCSDGATSDDFALKYFRQALDDFRVSQCLAFCALFLLHMRGQCFETDFAFLFLRHGRNRHTELIGKLVY